MEKVHNCLISQCTSEHERASMQVEIDYMIQDVLNRHDRIVATFNPL